MSTLKYLVNGKYVEIPLVQGPQGVIGPQGPQGPKGDQGETGAAGSDGTNAHIVQDLTEDTDGTRHLYLRTWTGDDESTATTSPDLMLQVNELSAALQEIIDNYTTETSSKS